MYSHQQTQTQSYTWAETNTKTKNCSNMHSLSIYGICSYRFHVDAYSSAHVYLRMEGITLDAIPAPLVNMMAQLTRANSIEGSKKPSLKIVYTPITNVTKEKGLDIGTVVFKDKSLCRFTSIVADKELSKIIMKTKKEVNPDLKKEHDDYVKMLYQKQHEEEEKAKKEYATKKKEEIKLKQSFEELMSKDKMKANAETANDDFW